MTVEAADLSPEAVFDAIKDSIALIRAYDSGGMLPPGMTAEVNLTGRPEAVLTPDETAALRAVARQLAAGGGGALAAGHPTVTQIWNGPQMPSQETLAEMERHLSLLMG